MLEGKDILVVKTSNRAKVFGAIVALTVALYIIFRYAPGPLLLTPPALPHLCS